MAATKKNKRRIAHPLAAILALFVSHPLIAQQGSIAGAVPPPGIGAAASIDSASGGGDSDNQARRAWSIKPRLGVSLTASDNANINGNARGESDVITEITPGVRINAQTARLRGYLDYSLRGQYFAQSSQHQHQNGLNSFATLEAIDKWLFVDVSGSIAQQTISAFGPQSTSNTVVNNNSTETRTFRLSPYIRGTLGGDLADYMLRYNASTTRASTASNFNVDVNQWVGQLRGGTPFQNLKWSIDGNSQTADYTSGYKANDDAARLMLTYLITPQFSISASGGWERNDYASATKQSHTTHGYGFDWSPTPRTKISAFKERRFFGDGHRFSFDHRFPLSSIRYTDTRDVSVLPNQFGTVGLGSMYDMYYNMLANQYPGADPILLADYVNQIFMLAGIDPNRQITSGFMSARASKQRQQQLSWILQGARNTLTVQFNRSQNSSFAAMQFDLLDDFSRASSITQKGLGVTLSHRLSGVTNLNLTASRQKSNGTGYGTLNLGTTTTLYQAALSTKLGPRTTGTLTLRRSEHDGSINPYTENALIGAVLYTY